MTLANVGDWVRIRAVDTNSRFSERLSASDVRFNEFVMTGKIAASGSIMYLLKKDGIQNNVPDSCFFNLFKNCTSLTTAPDLPATELASNCYNHLFSGCTSLNSIKIGYTGNFSGNDCFGYWVNNVASTGTFYYNGSDTTRGISAIPAGWTIQSF